MIGTKSKVLQTGVFLGLLLPVLAIGSACTPIGAVVGAGATAGVAAMSERGVQGTASDLAVHAQVLEKIASADHGLAASLSFEVYEGKVLAVGPVADEAEMAKVVGLIWQVDGVTDVINELMLTDNSSLLDTTRDNWISTQLKTALTFDGDVFAINYGIETKNKIVYLMGIAQSQRELDRVIAHARAIDYVRRVVSHVRIKTPAESAKTEKGAS